MSNSKASPSPKTPSRKKGKDFEPDKTSTPKPIDPIKTAAAATPDTPQKHKSGRAGG